MQAIQLNLWDGMPTAPTPTPSNDLEICARGTNESTLNLNPCLSCPLRGLCPIDECGMRLDDALSEEDNIMTFEDWLTLPLPPIS